MLFKTFILVGEWIETLSRSLVRARDEQSIVTLSLAPRLQLSFNIERHSVGGPYFRQFAQESIVRLRALGGSSADQRKGPSVLQVYIDLHRFGPLQLRHQVPRILLQTKRKGGRLTAARIEGISTDGLPVIHNFAHHPLKISPTVQRCGVLSYTPTSPEALASNVLKYLDHCSG